LRGMRASAITETSIEAGYISWSCEAFVRMVFNPIRLSSLQQRPHDAFQLVLTEASQFCADDGAATVDDDSKR